MRKTIVLLALLMPLTACAASYNADVSPTVATELFDSTLDELLRFSGGTENANCRARVSGFIVRSLNDGLAPGDEDTSVLPTVEAAYIESNPFYTLEADWQEYDVTPSRIVYEAESICELIYN